MYDVRGHITKLLSALPDDVRLVAVSKFHPKEYIEEAYAVGQRIFGESHVQELQQKVVSLPQDIEWHFIGHLQTNKVKYIAPYISMIESVDSERLIAEIGKHARKCNRVIDILLEIHLAKEDSKTGLLPEECIDLLQSGIKQLYPNIRICGLMTMASNTDDKTIISKEFDEACRLFNFVKQNYFPEDEYFAIRSWGMSGDFDIAITHGSNMIRVGTMLFGPRVY